MTPRTCVAGQVVRKVVHSLRQNAPYWAGVALAASIGTGCEPASQAEVSLGTKHQSIVGGKPAPARAYPWMVGLFEIYKSKQYFFCGGTLIDATHVLTAAHCSLDTRLDYKQHLFVTEPTSPKDVVVARRPGSLAALEDEDFVAVRSVIVHPQFDEGSTDYDVAVWELAAPVRLREYPRLMTSPAVQDFLSALHLPARAIGYGARGEGDEGSDVLLQVDVPLVSRERCRDAYAVGGPPIPPEEIITDRMICAGSRAGGKGSCYGDSGSPLLMSAPGKPPLVAGVTSWGASCADPDYPGVYANVAALADYIQACQAGVCETRAPTQDCDWGYVDCDGNQASNGCEVLMLSPATCGVDCDSPTCGKGEACLIGETLRCAPARPVIPSARCVFKQPDELGEYLAWFSVLNENEDSIQIPMADQHFTDGASEFITLDGIPPGLIEYATLAVLERPDAGSYTLLGPDGQTRTASITADTPACPTEEESPEQLTLRVQAHTMRLHDVTRARARGLDPTRIHSASREFPGRAHAWAMSSESLL